jgi:hypothetical protein
MGLAGQFLQQRRLGVGMLFSIVLDTFGEKIHREMKI